MLLGCPPRVPLPITLASSSTNEGGTNSQSGAHTPALWQGMAALARDLRAAAANKLPSAESRFRCAPGRYPSLAHLPAEDSRELYFGSHNRPARELRQTVTGFACK